ncbi:MAG: hypothetical protein IKA41_02295, partial [Bacteroidaceae bacterium]|nr:hypothetical protein [Bacteroidaceae bacterium]MBR2607528.1 hypothetical protein [Bacteroidaceae bacterium]
TAQRKISYSLLGSQIFVNENIAFGELRLRSLIIASKLAFYSLARTLPRSSFVRRHLSFASRGSVKFGHTCGASENLPLFSAPLCSLRL